jgi:hypothetical protein
MIATDGPPLIEPSRLCALSGISYRQCDYWTGNGWLRPAALRANVLPPSAQSRDAAWTPTLRNPGSGQTRLFPLTEVSVAYVMHYLIGRAHLTVARSADVARGFVEDGQRAFDLCEHVTVVLRLDLPAWPIA